MSVKVVFRKDRNKWQVTYWFEGERKRPLFDSKREADNFSRRIELGLRSENKESIKLEAAIQSYYADVSLKKKGKTSQSNDKRYGNLLYHFMSYERQIERLGSITLQDLEAFQYWLLEQKEFDDKPMKMGPSTVNRAFHTYRHFFKKHVQWGNIEVNPCVCLDNLPEEENARRAMTFEEYCLVYPKAEDWFKPTLKFIFLTGVPPSCIERLKKSDIDFESSTYVIKRRKGGKIRTITMQMNEEVEALLKAQCQEFNDGLEAVFRNEHGKPLLADWCSKVGNKAIKDAGVKGVVLYCLRHALATDLTDANVATELVRQVMGHASITTTQRYAKRAKGKTLSNALTLVRGGLVAG